MPDAGHIELERAVASIVTGARQRTDLGDLGPLKRSIETLGLLQPITVSPDGVLICGRRRLEAIRELGWPTVKVWVRSGISDRLNSLLAWQDENTLHKPLSVIESADLYRELRVVLAEDAARRQHATRFGATDGKEDHGGADSAPPPPPGKTRRQAAETITGSASYSRLEQVNALEDIAHGSDHPEAVRNLARAGLDEIRDGKPVSSVHEHVMTVKRQSDGDELDRLAHEALERIRQPRSRRTKAPTPPRRKRSTRAFVHTWADMDGWSARYDATDVGPALTDEEWALFERVLAESTTFHAAARSARDEAGSRGSMSEDAAHLHVV